MNQENRALFIRPYGTDTCIVGLPSDKSLGYCQPVPTGRETALSVCSIDSEIPKLTLPAATMLRLHIDAPDVYALFACYCFNGDIVSALLLPTS